MLGPASLVPVSLASAIFRMPPPGTPCRFCCQIGVLALPCRLFCRFDGAARLCISLARLSSLLRAAATICACVGPLPFAILTPGLKFGLLVLMRHFRAELVVFFYYTIAHIVYTRLKQ